MVADNLDAEAVTEAASLRVWHVSEEISPRSMAALRPARWP